MKRIVYYEINGKIQVKEWFKELDSFTFTRVQKAISRLAQGNFGDIKIIAPALYEMRLFYAGGLRIYFTEQNGQIIILLCAGDKKTQSKDIAKAKKYLQSLGGQ